jgi:hypothetical protein
MEKQKPKISFAERDACTIGEFCASIAISRSSYYNMPPEDRPVEMEVGASKRISREARFDFRRRMEAKAAEARAAARDVA